MSLLIGPVSGALIAGGFYYGFSNLIHTRTEQLTGDLNSLSVRLIETPILVQAPPAAAERITQRPFTTLLHAKWNEQLGALFHNVRTWDERAVGWGRKLLYGSDTSSSPSVTKQQ